MSAVRKARRQKPPAEQPWNVIHFPGETDRLAALTTPQQIRLAHREMKRALYVFNCRIYDAKVETKAMRAWLDCAMQTFDNVEDDLLRAGAIAPATWRNPGYQP